MPQGASERVLEPTKADAASEKPLLKLKHFVHLHNTVLRISYNNTE